MKSSVPDGTVNPSFQEAKQQVTTFLSSLWSTGATSSSTSASGATGPVADIRGLNDDFIKYSCGTESAQALPCKNIIAAMSEIGLDVSGHSSTSSQQFEYFGNTQLSEPTKLVELPAYERVVGTLEDRSQCVKTCGSVSVALASAIGFTAQSSLVEPLNPTQEVQDYAPLIGAAVGLGILELGKRYCESSSRVTKPETVDKPGESWTAVGQYRVSHTTKADHEAFDARHKGSA